jgi:hypothetical protein
VKELTELTGNLKAIGVHMEKERSNLNVLQSIKKNCCPFCKSIDRREADEF